MPRLRLLAALALAIFPSTGRSAADPEPSFDGKSLSQWMTLLTEARKDRSHASQDWRKAPWALSKIGVPALPALIAALDHPDPNVRLRAIRPIVAMGNVASDAAPALARRLKDEAPRVRQWSAAALGQIGPPAAGGVPGLIEALKDAEPSVRQAAAAALGAIGATDAIEPLQGTAADPNLGVQRAARLALDRLQPAKP